MEKITKRNMYEALVAMAEGKECGFERDGEFVPVYAEMIKEFAENEIALLDKKSLKAKERSSAKKAASDALAEAVKAALSPTEFEPIAEITARVEGEEVTIHKVTYRLNALAEEGIAEKQEITIPSADGKKGRRVQGYKLATVEVEDSTELTD